MTFWLYQPTKLITSSKSIVTNDFNSGDIFNILFLMLSYLIYWMKDNNMPKKNIFVVICLLLGVLFIGSFMTYKDEKILPDKTSKKNIDYTNFNTSLSID